MTREEAYERNNCGDDEIVNIIYDDLDKEICGNCKYYTGEKSYCSSNYCKKHHDPWSKGEMFEFDMGKDFGCNKFEAKDGN